MESVYSIILWVCFGTVIFFLIRAVAAFPPSLHFIGRLKKAQLSEEVQNTLAKKEEIGTRYYIKTGISFAIFILLIVLYPFIFGKA